MKVYALIFTVGLSSGYAKIIGLYDKKQKAEEIKEKHKKENAYLNHHYKIKEIEINKNINEVYNEW